MVQNEADGSAEQQGSPRQAPDTVTPTGTTRFSAWLKEWLRKRRVTGRRLLAWLEKPIGPTSTTPVGPASSEKRQAAHTGLGRATSLAFWAPTATGCALTGAAVITAVASQVTALTGPYSMDVSRVIAGVTFFSSTALLLLWFASSPQAATTAKRFGAVVGTAIVVMGLVGLALAADRTLGYFLGNPPLDLPGIRMGWDL